MSELNNSGKDTTITAEIEKEMFKIIWQWLSTIGIVVAAITTAAWALIYAAIVPQAEQAAFDAATKEITQVSTEFDELSSKLAESNEKILEIRVKADSVIEIASNSANEASARAKEAAIEAQKAKESVTVAAGLLRNINNDITSIEVLRGALSDMKSLSETIAQNPTFQNNIASQILPVGMIAAFSDLETCPEGWAIFESAMGRTVVGATPRDWSGSIEKDEADKELRIDPGEKGGYMENTINSSNLPSISAQTVEFDVIPVLNQSSDRFAVVKRNRADKKIDVDVKFQGSGNAILNMQPYIALLYCKKL